MRKHDDDDFSASSTSALGWSEDEYAETHRRRRPVERFVSSTQQHQEHSVRASSEAKRRAYKKNGRKGFDLVNRLRKSHRVEVDKRDEIDAASDRGERAIRSARRFIASIEDDGESVETSDSVSETMLTQQQQRQRHLASIEEDDLFAGLDEDTAVGSSTTVFSGLSVSGYSRMSESTLQISNTTAARNQDDEDDSVVSTWSVAQKGDLVALFADEREEDGLLDYDDDGSSALGLELIPVNDDPWNAAKRGDLKALKQFDKHPNMDWSICDRFDCPPLYYACHSGAAGGMAKLKVVWFLLRKYPGPVPRSLFDRCRSNAISSNVVRLLDGDKYLIAKVKQRNCDEGQYEDDDEVSSFGPAGLFYEC